MNVKLAARRLRHRTEMFMMRRLGGTLQLNLFGHRVSIAGWNAMHFAITIAMKNDYIVIRPPNMHAFRYNGAFIYRSPNGTPQRATWLWYEPRGWDHYDLKEKAKELKQEKKLGASK